MTDLFTPEPDDATPAQRAEDERKAQGLEAIRRLRELVKR